MANQKLLDYIKQQLQEGVSNKDISEMLLEVGWKKADIDEAFSALGQAPRQPKMPKWKKVIFTTVGIIIIVPVVIIFIPQLLSLFVQDISPINDSDLKLEKVSVQDSDNAYLDLIQIESVLYEPEDSSQIILDIIDGKTWDAQFVENLVFQNAQTLEYFRQASQKPKYQNPSFADPEKITSNAPIPKVISWRKAARFSAIRALYLSAQGRREEALSEALNSVRVGQKIQNSQVTTVEYLTSMAMKEIGLNAFQRIILSRRLLEGSAYGQYIKEFNEYYNNENAYRASFKGLYHMNLLDINALAQEAAQTRASIRKVIGNPIISIKKGFYFQPNKTKLMFVQRARANIENASIPCGKIKPVKIQKFSSENPFKLFFEENAVGKVLYDVEAVSLASLNIKKCEEDLLVAVTQTALALNEYYYNQLASSESGNYPDTLEELVPNYLSSVPEDPFDGKPLKYSREKKILYSVGLDMQDSGGSTGDDWKQMKDPTFFLQKSKIMSGWGTYRNLKYKFEIKYPIQFSIQRESPQEVSFYPENIIKGTVDIYVKKKTREECVIKEAVKEKEFLSFVDQKSVSSVIFYHFNNTPPANIGMCGMSTGCWYEDIYRTFYNESCYEIKYIRSDREFIEGNPYSPQRIVTGDVAEVPDLFYQIFSSFRFLD